MITFRIEKKTFQFKAPSGTSRGVLTEKHAWFIQIENSENQRTGIGECSVIPGLSPDYSNSETYSALVTEWCERIFTRDGISSLEMLYQVKYLTELTAYPSILFGIETALLDLNSQKGGILIESDFTSGKQAIPINGLIWMGTKEFMLEQIEQKIKEGFSCIKLKIGSIDFESELQLLRFIREKFSAKEMILRVDANGAFSPNEALDKLEALAHLEIHSIEQPIKQGQWREMAQLCSKNIVPIALDEELIGISKKEEKEMLLDTICPQFIILKPSLHGGLIGTREWISLAEDRDIPWWITSALESNVGLNTIAQFTATYTNLLHQGLGTGSLYVQNTPSKLRIYGGLMSWSC